MAFLYSLVANMSLKSYVFRNIYFLMHFGIKNYISLSFDWDTSIERGNVNPQSE